MVCSALSPTQTRFLSRNIVMHDPDVECALILKMIDNTFVP